MEIGVGLACCHGDGVGGTLDPGIGIMWQRSHCGGCGWRGDSVNENSITM